jgi:hypothetical protein
MRDDQDTANPPELMPDYEQEAREREEEINRFYGIE